MNCDAPTQARLQDPVRRAAGEQLARSVPPCRTCVLPTPPAARGAFRQDEVSDGPNVAKTDEGCGRLVWGWRSGLVCQALLID